MNCIAIGNQAGYSTQQPYGVAIGYQAGYSTQGSGSIAIGMNAGYSSLGQNCIAIGNGVSSTYANCIVIDATNSSLTTTNPNTCFIKPLRNVGPSIPVSFAGVYYNPTTGELGYVA